MKTILKLCVLVGLAGCASPAIWVGINQPYEGSSFDGGQEFVLSGQIDTAGCSDVALSAALDGSPVEGDAGELVIEAGGGPLWYAAGPLTVGPGAHIVRVAATADNCDPDVATLSFDGPADTGTAGE